LQRRVLTAHRIGNGGGEAVRPFPFIRRAHRAITADLVDAQ